MVLAVVRGHARHAPCIAKPRYYHAHAHLRRGWGRRRGRRVRSQSGERWADCNRSRCHVFVNDKTSPNIPKHPNLPDRMPKHPPCAHGLGRIRCQQFQNIFQACQPTIILAHDGQPTIILARDGQPTDFFACDGQPTIIFARDGQPTGFFACDGQPTRGAWRPFLGRAARGEQERSRRSTYKSKKVTTVNLQVEKISRRSTCKSKIFHDGQPAILFAHDGQPTRFFAHDGQPTNFFEADGQPANIFRPRRSTYNSPLY